MKFLILVVLIGGMGIGQSHAQAIVTFGPKEAKIMGSIPYSVIGQYRAYFRVFKGRMALDKDSGRVLSVYLGIEARSIKSNCPWCDKIARSRELLNTARYPKIIFQSERIMQDERGYKVKGILGMHGVNRRVTFPFKVEVMIDQKTKRRWLDLKGRWSINRKDFNIIWNKSLERIGIGVRDNFTVDWRIKVYMNSL